MKGIFQGVTSATDGRAKQGLRREIAQVLEEAGEALRVPEILKRVRRRVDMARPGAEQSVRVMICQGADMGLWWKVKRGVYGPRVMVKGEGRAAV